MTCSPASSSLDQSGAVTRPERGLGGGLGNARALLLADDGTADQAGAPVTEVHLDPGGDDMASSWTESSGRLTEMHALTSRDDWNGARRRAEAILAGDEYPDDDAALGEALATLGWVAWKEGRARDAVGMLRAAVHRSELGSVHCGGSELRLGLAHMMGAIGDIGPALASVEEFRSDLGRSGDGRRSVAAGIVLAGLHLAAGSLDEAGEEAETALGSTSASDTSPLAAAGQVLLARVELIRGNLDQAAGRAGLGRAAIGDAFGSSQVDAACAWLEAQLLGHRAGPVEAVESVHWLYECLPEHKPLLMCQPDAVVWLVRTAQAAGDPLRAERAVVVAESLSADNPEVEALAAIALHARGLLEGDLEKLCRAALGHPQPWSASSASEDVGLVLGFRDREAAKVWLDGALVGFERIGATRDAARVRDRLRCVGRRRGRRVQRSVSGWASLTETEQEVARYVAGGMTNRQVAASMYLSRHTIDFHLRAIFRKLVVGSRVELTRVVLDHGRPAGGDAERTRAGAR
jgi:DNA-binding CsgD family transcriptional regulator